MSEDDLARESIGVTVPDDHVGAFVAQVFEDPERDTTWATTVDRLIAPEAHDAWEALSSREQVQELLVMADDYDEQAVEQLAAIPTNRSEPTDRMDELFAEARRCRRNADRIRDAIAAGYADGRIDDDALIEGVESADFGTDTVAERERLLETVTDIYDYDFRPYGGTLMTDEDEEVPLDDHEPW